ncbi:hypothetical protein, partial [Mycobacterium montefiorense]|uniref:hypothetical protein n=1 Tax=Mycobacterium montefiorense TaxID=154654 RepID=UPI0021C482E0
MTAWFKAETPSATDLLKVRLPIIGANSDGVRRLTSSMFGYFCRNAFWIVVIYAGSGFGFPVPPMISAFVLCV